MLICFLALIIHESGHILAMVFFGFKPDLIRIRLFEIAILDKSRHQRNNKQNFFIILFGPLFNFVCFILGLLVNNFLNFNLLSFSFSNIALCMFNLLPVINLDGGQMLNILLSKYYNDKICEKVINIVTAIFIAPMLLLGFLLLNYSKYNFSLLLICLYLVISILENKNKYY